MTKCNEMENWLKAILVSVLIVLFFGCTTFKAYDPTGEKVLWKYQYPMFQNKSWSVEKLGDDFKVYFNSDSKPFYDALLGLIQMNTELMKRVGPVAGGL